MPLQYLDENQNNPSNYNEISRNTSLTSITPIEYASNISEPKNSIPNLITNDSSIQYYYYLLPDTLIGSSNSTQAQTTINYATVGFTKTTNLVYADVGEILIYNSLITNTGNTNVSNAVFVDKVPNGTIFVNKSLFINGLLSPGNPEDGISFDLSPGEMINIQFSVLVYEIPSPNPIPNFAKLHYFYTVDPDNINGNTGNRISNIVKTQINTAILSMNKTSTPTYPTVGTNTTYNILIKNTGNITATNILFTDTIPDNTTFVDDSFSIDGVTISGSPAPPGINIGTLSAGQLSTISFKVTINAMPSTNNIENSASTTFNYIVDPTNTIVTVGSSSSNISLTTIAQSAILSLTISSKVINTFTSNSINLSNSNGINALSSDVISVFIGDIISYTVILENIGSTTANNIFFNDTIPNGTSFIPDSININGVTIAGGTVMPPPGVSVPDIGVNETTTLSFNVVVTSIPSPNPAINICSSTYSYSDSLIGTTGTSSNYANTVYIQVVSSLDFNVTSSLDKSLVQPCEKVKYTLTITNTESEPIQNILVTCSSSDTVYDGNGVTVNSTLFNNLNPNTPIDVLSYRPDLFPLQTHDSVVISYYVIIKNDSLIENVTISQNVVAKYNFNSQDVSISKDSTTPASQVVYMWNTINLSNIFTIPHRQPDISDVISYKSLVEVIDYKIIKTPISSVSNFEGIRLTGKKLLVIGNLKSTIQYSSNEFNEAVFTLLSQKRFSMLIAIDNNMSLSNISSLNLFIYNEDFRILDHRRILNYIEIFAMLKVDRYCTNVYL